MEDSEMTPVNQEDEEWPDYGNEDNDGWEDGSNEEIKG